MGWSAIIYLAISGIDQEQFEATKVDGASRLRQYGILRAKHRPYDCNSNDHVHRTSDQHRLREAVLAGNPLVVDYSQVLDLYALNYGLGMGRFSFGTAIGMFNSIVSILLFAR